MYDTVYWYKNLQARLLNRDSKLGGELGGQVVRLMQVELGLRLLERLGLDDEPASVLWVVLSGLSIPGFELDDTQRRVLATARVLLPFGRFAWEAALREYARIPIHWRLYEVDPDTPGQRPARCIPGHDSEGRLSIYDATLEKQPQHARNKLRSANVGTASFDIYQPTGPITIPITLPEEWEIPGAPRWFEQQPNRRPLCITFDELNKMAEELDQIEADWPSDEKGHWRDRLEKIHYLSLANGYLTESEGIDIDGIANIAGMVGSGKSTLMDLVAVREACGGLRTTLVVSDTASALERADMYNRWLCREGEPPKAVVLFGRTQRGLHLHRLAQTQSFRKALEQRREHWGLRWLDISCPISGLIPPEKISRLFEIGDEPCEKLRKDNSHFHICPLFTRCPSQRLWSDMRDALIWITTPGAMGQARVPAAYEPRDIKLGELIYEQSDLIIFDEVDLHQQTMDAMYAPLNKLFDPSSAKMDQLDVATARGLVPNRALLPGQRRWVAAVGHVRQMGTSLISQLADTPLLRRWVESRYFTAFSLFYDLAYRLVGHVHSPGDRDLPLEERERLGRAALPIRDLFDELMRNDPDAIQPPRGSLEDSTLRRQWALYDLSSILDLISSRGDPMTSPATARACEEWIRKYIPDIDATLARLAAQPAPRPGAVGPDTIDSLVKRMGFALAVAALNRNLLIVFAEWYNSPERISGEQLDDAPADWFGLLPTPPTGQMFGFAYHHERRRLSVFEYTSIGRYYVMHFEQIRSELEGRRGPNVLALSGTSHMPDFSQWHFDVRVAGALKPEQRSQDAIRASMFTFLPQFEDDRSGRRAIRVSGTGENMLNQLRALVAKLAGKAGNWLSPLRAEIEDLDRLGLEQPRDWNNRSRLLLLVNSYEQARIVAIDLAAMLPDWRDQIYGLTTRQARRNEDDDQPVWTTGRSLERGDVEAFGWIDGKILVAPMLAIGRGYNILNGDQVAAFGAIYFLTRPMPQPFDLQALAREMNHKTLKWLKDPNFKAWREHGLYAKGVALSRESRDYWREAESRRGYADLKDADGSSAPRDDLAATTAGLIIQACGRLLRGGVPFHAYFVDSAWGDSNANGLAATGEPGNDTPESSLLAAMIQVLNRMIASDPVSRLLYEPLADALSRIQNFRYSLE